MGRRSGRVSKTKRSGDEPLDYHEGLSQGQVRIILREFGLDSKYDEFNEWLYGQTCPIVQRRNRDTGAVEEKGGVYEYDLFRWIRNKRYGNKEALIWD